jgi:hypothetical protein
LLPVFNKLLMKGEDRARFNQFFVFLIKLRLLFDELVVRSKQGEDGRLNWSIRRIISPENTASDCRDSLKELKWLQSCLQVTYYKSLNKRWLKYFLNELLNLAKIKEGNQLDIEPQSSSKEKIDKNKMANEFQKEFQKGWSAWVGKNVYPQGEKLCRKLRKWTRETVSEERKNGHFESDGTKTSHLVLNYLDLLLYELVLSDKKESDWLTPEEYRFLRKSVNNRASPFRFTYRNSVEHFFPQHPSAETGVQIPSNLDALGNLCLTTVAENAKYNNLIPKSKINEYERRVFGGSLKLRLMAHITERDGEWHETQIEKHQGKMLELLDADLEILNTKDSD